MAGNCEELKESLAEYAVGKASPLEEAKVAAHLKKCESCTRQVEELRAIYQAIDTLPQEELPETLAPRIRQAVRERAARREGSKIWVRLAVPAAVLTGLVAISFALKQPRDQQVREMAALEPAAEMRIEGELGPSPYAHHTPAAPRLQPDLRGGVSAPRERPETIAPPSVARGGAPRGVREPEPSRPMVERESASAAEESYAARPGMRDYGRGGISEGTIAARPSAPTAETRAPKLEAFTVDAMSARETPSMTLGVIRGEAGSMLALRAMIGEEGRFTLQIGRRQAGEYEWLGQEGKPAVIPLSEEQLGRGPEAIPVVLSSKAEIGRYTLFIPVMERLGQVTPTAPVISFDKKVMKDVLAEFVALSGVVVLAEEPLTMEITKGVRATQIEVALRELAQEAGMEMQQEGIAYTLVHR